MILMVPSVYVISLVYCSFFSSFLFVSLKSLLSCLIVLHFLYLSSSLPHYVFLLLFFLPCSVPSRIAAAGSISAYLLMLLISFLLHPILSHLFSEVMKRKMKQSWQVVVIDNPSRPEKAISLT